MIRRLQCEGCSKIHHELPDLLVPYKRYDAESIEGSIMGSSHCNTAADESTIQRWRSWFLAWVVYAQGILQSLSIRYELPVEDESPSSPSVLRTLGRFVGTAAGWLSRTVRSIANSHYWVQTRSAFLTARIEDTLMLSQ